MDLEKQKFEFRKTYRNWFKGLSDEFPAYKSVIVQYYKANMDKSHEELLKEFYQQARPFFEVLANADHAFFESCATFYPEIQYPEFVKGTPEPFRKEQMVYLNKLSYIAILLMSDEKKSENENENECENEDTSLLYKFVMNVQTLDGTDMDNLMKSLESAFDPEKINESSTGENHSALLHNPLLSSLAEEISQEITIPDAFKHIESPQDIFKLMMNKDGKSFMEDMVKTVGSKIQSKIKNGELNEQDLFQQAQMMMGSVFNNNPMFGNLFGGGGGGGGGASAAAAEETPAERKAELRKALREKLKNKRNERN